MNEIRIDQELITSSTPKCPAAHKVSDGELSAPSLPKFERNNDTKLYATDLADFAFCPRLFFMKKMKMVPRKETFAMLRGTIEHEVRRTTTTSLKAEYQSCDSLNKLKKIDYSISIDNAIAYGLDLGKAVSSKYWLGLDEMLPTLRYRLLEEEKERFNQAITLAAKGFSMGEILETLLPWRLEHGVGSTILGVTGRVDQIYKLDNKLVPLDFKTHIKRFGAFLLKPAFFEQLAVYGLLLERKYSDYKVNYGIIEFTEDLTKEKLRITKKDKNNVIEHIKEAREILSTGLLPSKLSGDKAIRCQGCFFKDFCFSLKNPGGIEKC